MWSAVWGEDVRVVVARELTKLHEEFLRGTVAEVRAQLAARERVRGEIVLLIEAASQAARRGAQRREASPNRYGTDGGRGFERERCAEARCAGTRASRRAKSTGNCSGRQKIAEDVA